MTKDNIIEIVKKVISNNSEEMPFDGDEGIGIKEIRIDGNAFDHIAEEIAEKILE